MYDNPQVPSLPVVPLDPHQGAAAVAMPAARQGQHRPCRASGCSVGKPMGNKLCMYIYIYIHENPLINYNIYIYMYIYIYIHQFR